MRTLDAPSKDRALALESGQIVEGRYRIIGLIADGGMGTVFLAEHVMIKRRVALKVLHTDLASDTEMVKRFMNEALAAGTLGHPHIVESTDMGFTGSRVPYIVYELLEGAVLTEEVYRVGGLPVRRALRIATQIASALEAAHNANIIHLDLKCDNVYLTDKDGAVDHVKVLDFGISKFMEADIENTQRGLVLGTPGFMAPEQVTMPDTVDRRADIYALGVVLYEMLTARRPFGRDDPRVLLYRIVHEQPPPLDRAGVPRELEELLFCKLLAKDPARRFQTMRQVQAGFEDILAGLRAASTPPEPSSVRPPRRVAYPDAPRPRAHRVWLVAALVAGLAGGGLAYAAHRVVASTKDAASAALRLDAEKLAATLDAGAHAIRGRAQDIASSRRLREAIETDPTTVADLARDERLLRPLEGEVLQLSQRRDIGMTQLFRIPATAPAIAPLAINETRIVSDGSSLVVVVSAPVRKQSSEHVGGALAIAAPVDLALIRRLVSEDALHATLIGLDPPLVLAATATAEAGIPVTVPISISSDFTPSRLSLAALIRPLAGGRTYRTASYASFGLGALLLLGFVASWLRSRA
jgi:tRNA A-37 threonylcarbamoyl transferase component Bud32